ncbi:MAG: hypothetical protein KatS3mg101_1059 [Patescibacteria group bacterium]|nr:MAG: hypothetical protein KatS3mg101_1059 [Patescibacteria group bacterium]
MAELKYPPLYNGLQKTLDAQLNVGVTSQMTLNNTTGVQNKPGVVVIDRIDTSGAEKSSVVREYISYTGVSGNNLIGLTRGLGGSTDQDHAVGAIVEFIPDVTVFQAINDVITTEHNPDGTHNLPANTSLTTPKIVTSIKDANGNEAIEIPATASAVNQVKITNAATGSAPEVAGSGDDANVGLKLNTKGTGLIESVKGHKFDTEAVFDAEYDNGNSGASATINWTNGNKQKLTLTGNATLTFTNPSGACNLILKLVQDATGGRSPTFPSSVKWVGGSAPTWSTAANAVDIVALYFDGTNYYAQAGIGFA